MAAYQFRDGLLARFGGGKGRVRQSDTTAWIIVKGPRTGIARSEFEYEIPIEEADQMLLTLCSGPPIEKIRHYVPFAGLVWSVDIHLEAQLRRPNRTGPWVPFTP